MVEDLILFYNWNQILKNSKSNSEILSIIENLTKSKNTINKKYDGNSFLLKPLTLLSIKASTDEKVEVLQVASIRNHFDYWFSGYTGILMDFCGITEIKLKLNRLIKIDYKNRLIYLIHEG